MGKTATSQSTVDAEPNLIRKANDVLDSQLSEEISCVGGQPSERTHRTLLLNKGEHMSLDGPKQTVIEDQLLRISSHLETHRTLDDPDFTELNANALEDNTIRDSSRSHSTSILEKIFGSTLSTNFQFS